MTDDPSLLEKLDAIWEVAKYRPVFSVGIVGLSVITAFLEGIGLSFILPVIGFARGSNQSEAGGIMEIFVTVYEFLNVPFTLEYILVGVGLVLTVRYTLSFLVGWLNILLQSDYVRHIRARSYQGALNARVGYFDKKGSDDILNAIITQSNYAARVIQQLIQLIKVGLVSIMYLLIILYIAPILTLIAVVFLGAATFLARFPFESGESVGSKVATANEDVQRTVQAGIQGIRDTKLFGLKSELSAEFEDSMDRFVRSKVNSRKNSDGISNANQLIAALSVFVVIYLGLEFASLTLESLALFLFAMFRLSPRVSNINDTIYGIETALPHYIRAREFIEEIESEAESDGTETPPDTVTEITFDDVTFSYDNEVVLRDIAFSVNEGEFVAFVGQSGAGKSTIVSLLTRMYRPDTGEIRAENTPISDFDLDAWREHVAVVRQDPYIFNETLRYNLTIGDRDASQEELEEVIEIARVDEFLDDLPEGYDTVLGDDGVRLSGGQKQRVALARALLKDADILVLDEATSDLDRNIETEVQRAIEEMDRDYMILAIAHRLSTVKNSDMIYTVADGRITDSGQHTELIEKGGEYADLYTQ